MVWPTAEEAKNLGGKITMVDFQKTYSYPCTDKCVRVILDKLTRNIVLGDSPNFTIPIYYTDPDMDVVKKTLGPLGYKVWRTRIYPGYGDYRKDAIEVDY